MAQRKIAVIGNRDSVMLWRALGVETVFANSGLAAARAVDRLAKEGAAIIYITEECAQQIPETIQKYLAEPFPALIPIPNHTGTTGLGMRGIRKNIEKAIGTDILFHDEESPEA